MNNFKRKNAGMKNVDRAFMLFKIVVYAASAAGGILILIITGEAIL